MKTTKILTLGVLIAAQCVMNFCMGQTDTTRMLDEIIVSDSRATERLPLTATTIGREALEERKSETSMSYIIEDAPSVVASGENGKIGNTSFRIRGVDATRINANINGITLNEAESQQVFWVNIPNLASMAQSIQIQRGIGASTGGSPSFGGALNMQTLASSSQPYAHADMALGSWNTRQYGFAAGTGTGAKGWAADLAYNGMTSDGYVRNGFCDHQSLFASIGKATDHSMLKAIVIIGKQHTGITWDGAMAEELDADPRHNGAGAYYDSLGNTYYYDNQSDNYNQRHYQLHYSLMPTNSWMLNAVIDYTHGDGYYEQYKDNKKATDFGLEGSMRSDFITQKKMLNGAYTEKITAKYSTPKMELSFGETFLYYDGNHFGEVIWSQTSLCEEGYEWYRNKGTKKDATGYARLAYQHSTKTSSYADLQYRLVDYAMQGLDEDGLYLDFHEQYHFFNPKAGLSYYPNGAEGGHYLYAVAGLAHREPTRADIKDALYMGDTVRAEAMVDIEVGYTFNANNSKHIYAAVNGYAMLYHDQLTASGRISPTGYALMENVERSYRIGVEVVGRWTPLVLKERLTMDGNVTLSSNKVMDYVYNYEDYNGVRQMQPLGNTDLSFSPEVVASLTATLRVPISGTKSPLQVRLTGKYVGQMYCDNTSRQETLQPAYFLLNAKVAYRWQLTDERSLTAEIVVNNLLNKHYRLPAWTSDYYAEDGSCTVYRGYYQQPGTNLMARLAFDF